MRIAEQRIREAIEKGELDNLRGKGKPLVFEDETWIPEDIRIAYRFLKNAGCIPPELELRNEVISLGKLISTIDDDALRLRKIKELNFKILKLNEMRRRPLNLRDFPGYEDLLFRKVIG